MQAKDFDKTLDLAKIKPYGDTMNDGKVQLSFTLPVRPERRPLKRQSNCSARWGSKIPRWYSTVNLPKASHFSIVTEAARIRSIILPYTCPR